MALAWIQHPKRSPLNRSKKEFMKSMLRIAVIAAGLAVAALPAARAADETQPTPPPAGGGQRGERRERRQEMMGKEMAEKLGLSQDQQDKIKVVREKTQADVKAVRDDTSLTEDQKREKIRELRMNSMKDVHAVLTPDQQAKMEQMRKERQERGPGGEPPPPPPPGENGPPPGTP
jgi:Spy/CpxP family protein refolding chaperone